MLRLKYIYISLKNTKTIDGFKWQLVACYFICPNFAQQLYFLSWSLSTQAIATNVCKFIVVLQSFADEIESFQ